MISFPRNAVNIFLHIALEMVSHYEVNWHSTFGIPDQGDY